VWYIALSPRARAVLRPRFVEHVGDRDPSPGLDHQPGRFGADAARRAGDQCTCHPRRFIAGPSLGFRGVIWFCDGSMASLVSS